MSQEIRVRLAPSPTGYLHIGTAQSALYNWLFARKSNGKFCLRIEDTDRERSTKEYEQSILNSLTWLGLDWDGDVVRQSTRNERYRKALDKLEKTGKVRTQVFTEEEKQAIRKEGRKASNKIYILPAEETAPPVAFTDIIRGEISVARKDIGNIIIARVAEDDPDDIIYLYNFVVVIDDLDMGITNVIRGEDHISNTPKQLMIYEALGAQPPQFAHLPLILAPDRSKLSKRHGATAVVDYKDDYLPEALLNFLGKLSFTFSDDIVDMEIMLKEFELSKVHKSGAVFDAAKLDWLNGEYIKKLGDTELIEKLKPFIGEHGKDIITKILPMARERLKKFSDIKEFSFFFAEPDYDGRLLIWKSKNKEEVSKSLVAVREVIEKLDEDIDKDKLRKELDELAVINGKDRGLVYWPLRVALTGLKASPDPVDVATVLGKEKTLERVGVATEKLNN